MNHVAALGRFRPDCNEPQRIAACVFRVQAVVNREDILRANASQNHVGRENLAFKSSRESGRTVKYGESIQLVHERTKQTLYVNVNDHGGLPFSMKAGFEDLGNSDQGCASPSSTANSLEDFKQAMWFDSWLQVQVRSLVFSRI